MSEQHVTEAIARLEAIHAKQDDDLAHPDEDTEDWHIQADTVLCDFLNVTGASAVVAAYDKRVSTAPRQFWEPGYHYAQNGRRWVAHLTQGTFHAGCISAYTEHRLRNKIARWIRRLRREQQQAARTQRRRPPLMSGR